MYVYKYIYIFPYIYVHIYTCGMFPKIMGIIIRSGYDPVQMAKHTVDFSNNHYGNIHLIWMILW